MIVVTNEALAARRRRQSVILSLGGFGVLVAGLVVNLLGVRSGAPGQDYVLYSYLALIVGSILSWAGMALSDRWALPPRPDRALADGLKGTGRGYRLYNWCLPADHVLLTPWGVTVLTIMNTEGPVTVQGTRWRDARPLLRRVLALGRRPVRDPSRLLELEIDALRRALVERDDALAGTAIDMAAVFSRPGMVLAASEPNIPALRADELRDWLRGGAKRPPLPPAERRRLERTLEALAEERLAADRPKPRRTRPSPRRR